MKLCSLRPPSWSSSRSAAGPPPQPPRPGRRPPSAPAALPRPSTTLATQAAVDTLRQAGTPSTRRLSRPASSASPSRSRRASAAAASWSSATTNGKVTTIDGREKAPAAMTPTSFWENGAPLPFNDARYSGLSVGVPGHRRGVGPRAGEVRDDLARAGAPAGHRRRARTASWSTRRSSTRRGDNADWFDDIPSSAALYLDPDGTPHDVGTTFRNPDLAETYERIAHLGPKGFYRGADRRRDRRRRPEPAGLADRRPRVAARRDDDARPAARTRRSSASRRTSATADWTSTAWARRRAAARPSARR